MTMHLRAQDESASTFIEFRPGMRTLIESAIELMILLLDEIDGDSDFEGEQGYEDDGNEEDDGSEEDSEGGV